MYHVVQNLNGRLVREPAGHNRKDAERQLRAVQVAVDEHTYVPPENVRFEDWCDRWLSELRREETTRRTYASSLQYAKSAIGNKPLRKITTTDVRLFLEYVERTNRDRKPPRKVSQTTLAKHLRHLGVCLQAAKAERLIGENPVRLLAPSARPKATKKRPSYFTDDELAKLWPELVGEPPPPPILRLARRPVVLGRVLDLGQLRERRRDRLGVRAELREQRRHRVLSSSR